MKTQAILLAVLGALLGGLAVYQWLPRTVTVVRTGPRTTDTVYVPELRVDTIIRTRQVVTSDTVRIPYEIVISNPVAYDCPDLPRIRGITAVEAGHSFDDTTQVALVDVWAEGQQTRVQTQVQKLWTPGYITYLEASDPLRVDYEPWPQPESDCGFWCRLTWFGIGAAGGALAWELAR